VLVKVYSERIRNYENSFFPASDGNWLDYGDYGNVVYGSVLCIMVAGAGSIISGALNIPYHYGTLIAAILCMIVFLTDIKGIVALSSFVTPILVLGILGAGFYVIVNMDAWYSACTGI